MRRLCSNLAHTKYMFMCMCTPSFIVLLARDLVQHSYQLLFLEFAILALASGNVRFGAPTLTRHISGSTGRSEPSFRDVLPVLVPCVPSKIHPIRPTHSLAIRRGLVSCQCLESVHKLRPCAIDISAHSAARELRFGEHVRE